MKHIVLCHKHHIIVDAFLPTEHNENDHWLNTCVNLEHNCNILGTLHACIVIVMMMMMQTGKVCKTLGCCSELMHLVA
jgi:hypothetical protein